LHHEKMNNMLKQSRVTKQKKMKTPISFYKENLGEKVSQKRLREMWNLEPETVRKRYKEAADKYNKENRSRSIQGA